MQQAIIAPTKAACHCLILVKLSLTAVTTHDNIATILPTPRVNNIKKNITEKNWGTCSNLARASG